MSDIIKLKHSKFWYSSFMIDGKLYRKTTKTTNKRQAEQIAAKFREEVLSGVHELKEQEFTIAEGFELYKKGRVNATPESKKRFEIGITFLSIWFNDNIISTSEKIVSLTSAHLHQMMIKRFEEGLAAGTVKINVGDVVRMVKFCKKNGIKVPDLEEPEIKVKNDRLRYFSKEEEDRILQELDPYKPLKTFPLYEDDPTCKRRLDMIANYDLFVLLLDLGCRLNEAAGLSWNDVDFNKNEIRLFRSKVSNESIIYMTSRVREILQRRYKTKINQWIFPNRDGGPKRTFTGLRRAVKRAGCDDATLHTARHTYASKLVQAGVSLYEVSAMLGHSNVKTTQRYSHLNKIDVSRKAAGVLENKDKSNVSTYILPETYIKTDTNISTVISAISQKSTSVLDTVNATSEIKTK